MWFRCNLHSHPRDFQREDLFLFDADKSDCEEDDNCGHWNCHQRCSSCYELEGDTATKKHNHTKIIIIIWFSKKERNKFFLESATYTKSTQSICLRVRNVSNTKEHCNCSKISGMSLLSRWSKFKLSITNWVLARSWVLLHCCGQSLEKKLTLDPQKKTT